MSFFRRIFGLRNKGEKYDLPKGWTEEKISKDTYTTHIPQEEKDKWVSERHKKHNVASLIDQDGFYLKHSGRSGIIYYVESQKLCEIEFEASGVEEYDILINFDNLKEWILPKKEILNPEELLQIKEKLKLWLEKEKIKADL